VARSSPCLATLEKIIESLSSIVMDFIVSCHYYGLGYQCVIGSRKDDRVRGKDMVARWVLANLMILRWFHMLRSSETIEPGLDYEETENTSAVAS
jgi:hypothetical protein